MSVDQPIVTISYFAALREKAAKDSESVPLAQGETPWSLYSKLQKRYCFSLEKKHLRVAVNEEFVSGDDPLRHNDAVVFIPPVAGG